MALPRADLDLVVTYDFEYVTEPVYTNLTLCRSLQDGSLSKMDDDVETGPMARSSMLEILLDAIVRHRPRSVAVIISGGPLMRISRRTLDSIIEEQARWSDLYMGP